MGRITEFLKRDKEKFLIARFGEKGKNMTLLGGLGRMLLMVVLFSIISFVAIFLAKVLFGS